MDKRKVLELAEISKIAVTDAEAEELAKELASVLGMLENMKEFEEQELFTVETALGFEELRKDTAEEDGHMAEKIKEEKDGSFTVPKVV